MLIHRLMFGIVADQPGQIFVQSVMTRAVGNASFQTLDPERPIVSYSEVGL